MLEPGTIIDLHKVIHTKIGGMHMRLELAQDFTLPVVVLPSGMTPLQSARLRTCIDLAIKTAMEPAP